MPTGPRPTARPGAGPGRGRPRARGGARPAKESRSVGESAPDPPTAGSGAAGSGAAPGRSTGRRPTTSASGPAEPSAPKKKRNLRRSSLTTRALALAVVILMLTISYANSLRIYFAQAREVASTKAEIAESRERIAALQTELDRWDDPAFVQLQARTRLGWVLPGEVGFNVVDADGKPLGGGTELSTGAKPAGEDVPESWYTRLWGSVEAADRPLPEPERDPADAKPITEKNVDDAPSVSPSPPR